MTSRREFLATSLALVELLHRESVAAKRRRVGVNIHNVDADALALVKQLGITQVRHTIQWNVWNDRTMTHYHQDELDAIDRMRAAHLDVLIVVHSPPTSAGPVANARAMADFMTTLVTLRRGLTWQIMNEMDADDGFNGGWFRAADHAVSQQERGEIYGRFLAPVYDAIKAADRTAKVVTGGIALEPTAFYQGMRSVARGTYDAVCVHCYGSPVDRVMREKSRALRPLLGKTPLWCTEWGSSSADDARQEKEIADTLLDNDANARYARTYLYVLAGGAEQYAIAKANGSLRSAARLLRNRVAP